MKQVLLVLLDYLQYKVNGWIKIVAAFNVTGSKNQTKTEDP